VRIVACFCSLCAFFSRALHCCDCITHLCVPVRTGVR
jgi:hypothetical protein